MGMLLHRHYTEVKREEKPTAKVGTSLETKVEVKEETKEVKKTGGRPKKY